MCTPGSGPTGRWPPRSPTKASRAWSRCGTTSTSSPPRSSSPTCTRTCWPAGRWARLRAGEAQLEAGEDAALGRTRSLAASLSYGFARAFTDSERNRLAVLHLFRDTVDVGALCVMGDPGVGEEDVMPELAGLERDTWIALLDWVADVGLLAALGGGHYHIHPALPWYFAALFTAAYGQPANPAARRAVNAYARAIGGLGDYYLRQVASGRAAAAISPLRAEEANLLNALALRGSGAWRWAAYRASVFCTSGLGGTASGLGWSPPSPRISATPVPTGRGPAANKGGAS